MHKRITFLIFISAIAIFAISTVCAAEFDNSTNGNDALLSDVSDNYYLKAYDNSYIDKDVLKNSNVDNNAILGDDESNSTPTHAKLSAKNAKTTFKTKYLYKIKVTDNNNKAIKGASVQIKISGPISKSLTLVSDSKGIVSFNTKNFKVGNYKIQAKLNDEKYVASKITTVLKVNKRPLLFKIKKSDGELDIRVKDKITKKDLNKIKLIVKLKRGNKLFKIPLISGYNKKLFKYHGACGIMTNDLHVGSTKVVITASNKNYKGSVVSNIKVSKFIKNAYPKILGLFTNGKLRIYAGFV